MIARLWWKEARQVWPVWGLLAAGGLALQAFVWLYWGDEVLSSGYSHVSLVVTMMYLFLIAAAVFAGERENRTLGLLDAIPIERWRVWTAKATFALATTAGLGALLWLGALVFGGATPEWRTAGVVAVVWCLTALGWGLLCSSLMSNALFAAVLGMTGLSVSLLTLVDLNNGPVTSEAMPALLVVALLTTAASALAFHLGGPPRWEPGRRVRPVRPLYVPMPPAQIEIEFAPRRLSRIWNYSVPRLAWETLREVQSALWILIAVGVVAPLALAMNVMRLEVTFWVWLSMGVSAILTGVSVFNGENRGRTNRFLLQHGARPGVVWAVKVLIWWLVAALIWWVASLPLGRPAGLPQPNMPWMTYMGLIYWAASGLTIGFAASALCGMAFRRGITAGLIALIVCILLYVPLGTLFAAGAFYPWHLIYVAAALLAVSWAWSGDWLLDRPGVMKWVRLGLYSTLALVGLSSAYIVNRAWAVPTLSPFEANRIFQFNRIAAPIAEEDNAAPLYREAGRLLIRSPTPAAPHGEPWNDDQSLVAGDWDVHEPAVTDWLNRIEPALEALREGARKPKCRYEDLRKVTEFTITSEPPTYTLRTPLIISALVRLAKGDLEGAWTEIETLLRMARQYSHGPRPWSYLAIEPAALGMAMRWAADPRQTVATLKAAQSAWKALPNLASPADRARAATLVFRNTLAMPRGELAYNLFFQESGGRKKIDPFNKLHYDVQTTPWEIIRARKVFDLLAAASIQASEQDPQPVPTAQQPQPPYRWPTLSIEEGGELRTISPGELQLLSDTTRLTNQAPWHWNNASRDLNNEVARRAMDWLFRLRLWQAQHDGSLPNTLSDLPKVDDEPELGPLDVYSLKPFGYVRSQGQHLLQLGLYDPIVNLNRAREERRLQPTDGYMLLYSVGPDGTDDRAMLNVDFQGSGDIVFQLKDGVKPPSEGK